VFLPLDVSLRVDLKWLRRRLDWELPWSEAVRYLMGMGLAMLRVREWLLLESSLSATLEVNGGASCVAASILYHRHCGGKKNW